MRNAAFGLTALAVLVMGWTSTWSRDGARAESPRHRAAASVPLAPPAGHAMAAAGNLMAFSSNASDSINQLTIIDAEKRVVSVYHIEKSTGRIELKGVRNVDSDLRIEEFNGVSPLPREIRALLEQ
jgi:hypothetical protein